MDDQTVTGVILCPCFWHAASPLDSVPGDAPCLFLVPHALGLVCEGIVPLIRPRAMCPWCSVHVWYILLLMQSLLHASIAHHGICLWPLVPALWWTHQDDHRPPAHRMALTLVGDSSVTGCRPLPHHPQWSLARGMDYQPLRYGNPGSPGAWGVFNLAWFPLHRSKTLPRDHIPVLHTSLVGCLCDASSVLQDAT